MKNEQKIDRYLGQKVDTKNLEYSADLLVRELRETNRVEYGIKTEDVKGVDLWRGYEASWIDKETDSPVTKNIQIRYTDNEYIVESKSLKLYLFSLHNQKLSEEEYLKTVTIDLSDLLETPVLISLPTERVALIVSKDLIHIPYMRSNCKVTGQPDFADLYVYSSREIEGLEDYVKEFRYNNHFHEEVIEMIYKHLQEQGHTELVVAGFFTRRGGIDINPIRWSSVELAEKYFAGAVRDTDTIYTTIKQ